MEETYRKKHLLICWILLGVHLYNLIGTAIAIILLHAFFLDDQFKNNSIIIVIYTSYGFWVLGTIFNALTLIILLKNPLNKNKLLLILTTISIICFFDLISFILLVANFVFYHLYTIKKEVKV